jgi:hypothetical protein
MKSFWNRRQLDLEGELRARRPQPRADFVTALAAEVRAAPPERTRAGRFGLAIALSGLILVVLASFGGIGYASSAASHAVKKPTVVKEVQSSAAQAQYAPFTPPKPAAKPAAKACGKTGGEACSKTGAGPDRDDLAAAVHRPRALDAAGNRPPAPGDRARPEDAQSAARPERPLLAKAVVLGLTPTG